MQLSNEEYVLSPAAASLEPAELSSSIVRRGCSNETPCVDEVLLRTLYILVDASFGLRLRRSAFPGPRGAQLTPSQPVTGEVLSIVACSESPLLKAGDVVRAVRSGRAKCVTRIFLR